MRRISNAFLRLFLSYTAVLLIPLICMSGIQTVSNYNMLTQNCSAYQSRLNYATDSLDTLAENIQRISESILVDEDVQSFIATSVIEKKTLSDLYTWKDIFEKYYLTGFNIKSVYLYSSTNKWIIGEGDAVKMDEVMYYATLGFTGMTYSEWQEFVSSDIPSGYYLMSNGELLYRMNILASGKRKSFILIQVDTDQILEVIQSISLEGGYVAVCNAGGAIILDTGISPFREESVIKDIVSDITVIEDAAPANVEAFWDKTSYGWYVLSFQPSNVLHSDAYNLSAQLLWITILMLAIDIALCLILSRNNAAPLKHLVAFISSQLPREYLNNDDEYILIENTMAALLEKNNNYRQLNDEQRELINFELVRCLLTGEFWNLERLEPLIHHSCLPLEHCKYGVVTIPNRTAISSHSGIERIQQALSSYEARVLSFNDKFVILFFLSPDTNEYQWNEQCHELAVALNADRNDTAFQLCISNLYCNFEEIHTAYDETIAVMEIMCADADNSIQEMHFSGISSVLSETYYDYPIDMELQIIHALKMGNTTLVTELLDEVRVRNYSDRKLSAFMTRQLMFEVRGTVIRCLHSHLSNAQIDHHVRALCHANSLDTLFQHIEDLSVEIADILHEEEDQRNTNLEEIIYTYLSQNYANASLTLADLVGPTGQSERFLYDFIRDRFNSTFSKLLEGLRITKACSLLRDGEATIKNVAHEVGYYSDHTFRLAFKRVMNVTPSEYAVAHARSRSEQASAEDN